MEKVSRAPKSSDSLRAKSFHEKAGECQAFSFIFPLFFSFFLFISFFQLFPLSQAASVATLPSALFVSDCRPVQVGCTRFSRCCYLVIDLCSPLWKGTGPGTVAVT